MVHFNYTSIPSLTVNDESSDVDAILSWALLGTTGLGALWAFVSPGLSRCFARSQDEQARDLEKGTTVKGDGQPGGSSDLPKEEPQNSKDSVPATSVDKTSKGPGKPKLYFIDNIKLFLTFLVVNTHTSAVFDSSGSPLKMEDVPSVFKTIMRALFDLNQAYYMALFFLLSGYFMPSSLDRKGLSMFLQDKFKRLGFPAIVCFFGLGPLMIFLLDAPFGLDSHYEYNPVQGPAWFVLWLLAFSVVYALVAQCTTCPRGLRLPGTCGLMALGLALGTVQFLVSIHFTRWSYHEAVMRYQVFLFNPFIEQGPFYMVFFAAGVAAKRNGWLDELASFSNRSLWTLRSLTVLFGALIISFPPWRKFLITSPHQHEIKFLLMLYTWALVQCCFGVVVSVVEIDLFRRCFNYGGSSIHRFFTESMYGVYLIHYPFVHIFAWTYTEILKRWLGKEMSFEIDPRCPLRFECTRDELILQPMITTPLGEPLDELQIWCGWAYTTVLTLLVVFPLACFLRKLPVLRDVL